MSTASSSSAQIPERVEALRGATPLASSGMREDSNSFTFLQVPATFERRHLERSATKRGSRWAWSRVTSSWIRVTIFLQNNPFQTFFRRPRMGNMMEVMQVAVSTGQGTARRGKALVPWDLGVSEVYGLASNSRAQQQEADRGTVMAVRSAIVINEIIQSQTRRSVPSAGTPPGSETGRKGLLGYAEPMQHWLWRSSKPHCKWSGGGRSWRRRRRCPRHNLGGWQARRRDSFHQSRHSLEGFTKSLDGGQRGGQFWPNGRTIKEKAQRTGEWKLCGRHEKSRTSSQTGRGGKRHVRRLWTRFLAEHPRALKTAEEYGSENYQLDEDVLKAWTERVGRFLKAKDFDEIVLRRPDRFVSPLNARLLEAWRQTFRRPRDGSWVRAGRPLSMCIPYCGIFPMTEEEDTELEEVPDMEAQLGAENYKSFLEEPDHARAEVQRYLDKGSCIELTEEQLREQFPVGTMSKAALTLKFKEDGAVKRRVIIDLLRSGGNERCRVRERIVLPRIQDVLDTVPERKSLWVHTQSAEGELGGPGSMWWSGAGVGRFVWHILPPGSSWERVGQHWATAWRPQWTQVDTWCSLQCSLDSEEHHWSWEGLPQCWQGCCSLWCLQMRCSRSCTWVIPCGFYKGLDGEEEKTWRWSSTCAEHLESSCSFAKGSVEQMRFGSERAWSSSWPRKWWYLTSCPRWWTRWNRHWRAGTTRAWCRSERSERWQGSCHGSAASLCKPGGASTSCTRSSQTVVDVRMDNERASKREDTRPKPFMAAVHRMELPRRWFIAMPDKLDKFALRRETLRQVPAQFALITDASPRGVGAIFADIDRQSRTIVPLEALEIPFTEEYARWMGIPWDDTQDRARWKRGRFWWPSRSGSTESEDRPCWSEQTAWWPLQRWRHQRCWTELERSWRWRPRNSALESSLRSTSRSMACGSRLAEPSTPTRTNTKTAGRGANASISKGKNNDVGLEPPWDRCSIEMGPSIQSGVGRLWRTWRHPKLGRWKRKLFRSFGGD